MPFELTNASATFQRLMNYVLHDYLNNFVVVYLDDILVCSETFDEHINHLRKVFTKLREANLVIKLKKCKFGQRKIKFLGHTIRTDGLRTDPENIEKIINCLILTDVTGVRKFMRLCNYYRKFIKDLSKLSKLLRGLLKKDVKFLWGSKEQVIFEKLKKILTEAPVLLFPNFDKPFVLCTDALLKGLGAVLEQEDENGNLRPVAYASKSLILAEKNYHTTDLECLAIIWSVKHFHKYLINKPFKIFIDHSALKSLQKISELTGRRARWIIELQYNYTIEYRSGKKNQNANALLRLFPEQYIKDKNSTNIK